MKFVNKNEFVQEDYRLDPKQFLDVREEQPKPIVLDIRPLEESDRGTFIGSHQLPADTIEDRLIQLPPFGTIILYSDSQNSGIEESLKLLWENGFTEIFYVDGGFQGILKGMIDVSEEDRKKIAENLPNIKGKKGLFLKVYGYDYEVSAIQENEEAEDKFEIEYPEFSVYFYPKVFRLIPGTTLSFKDGKPHVHHPRMDAERPEGTLEERINKVLEELINPGIAMHGGHVTLLDVKEDVAYIEMGGGCQGCGMSHVTLKNGIESTIFDHIPEITSILDVTDHAAGTNPYYQPETQA